MPEETYKELTTRAACKRERDHLLSGIEPLIGRACGLYGRLDANHVGCLEQFCPTCDTINDLALIVSLLYKLEQTVGYIYDAD